MKLTEEMLIKAKDIFRNVQRQFQNFDKSSVFSLPREFIEVVENYNNQKGHMFTREYIVDMAITFGGYLTVEFICLMEEVRTKNDPISQNNLMNKYKAAYFATFLDQYKEISGDEAAANGLCHVLAVAVEAALVEALPDDIARIGEERANFCQKNYFKVKVLTDLAKKKSFQLYTTYLSDIRTSFEYWTEQYVINHCTENEGDKLIEKAESIISSILIK